MLKKISIAIIVVLAIVFAWWKISPLLINRIVDEKFGEFGLPKLGEESDSPVIVEVSRGQFEGVDGHDASGGVILLQREDEFFLRFEEDFDSSNAPDVLVYFGRDGEYDPEAKIANLKGNRGGQNYVIPAEIDVADYNEIWTWCRAFSVGIARAKLIK